MSLFEDPEIYRAVLPPKAVPEAKVADAKTTDAKASGAKTPQASAYRATPQSQSFTDVDPDPMLATI